MYVTLTIEIAPGKSGVLQELLNKVQSYEIHYQGKTKQEVKIEREDDPGISDQYGRTSLGPRRRPTTADAGDRR